MAKLASDGGTGPGSADVLRSSTKIDTPIAAYRPIAQVDKESHPVRLQTRNTQNVFACFKNS